jgi:hypothetical protein
LEYNTLAHVLWGHVPGILFGKEQSQGTFQGWMESHVIPNMNEWMAGWLDGWLDG